MQLRQKTDQKKTLYYVEQLLIKYNATKECSAIKQVGGKFSVDFTMQLRAKKSTVVYCSRDITYFTYLLDGLDFYFGAESGARKLVEFFQSVIPMRYQHAKKLISHDMSSNIYNYK